ncbi:tetratricopeptide repeat protein [Streptomyces sp. NPDC051322]|uniref:tetratricopeptide repeat protein n=1 Tax=Streptomyces sp. NPDC051322 TaxID=3154645 RepID=UPI00344B37BE
MTDQAVESVGRAATSKAAPATGQFLGRRRELKALRADIERAGLDTMAGRKGAGPRVLLIAGRPGSGRSALAGELAGQLAADYPDGLLRARLSTPGGDAVSTAETARELLHGLGVPAPPGAAEEELTELVRAALAERRALLLLDDATDAEQVEPLLPDASASLVLATSTGPLTGLPDVRPCTLGGLDTGSAVELLRRFAGTVRVTVDPRTAETLAEECGGQPAALVLVGGWLAARPKASVADVTKQLWILPDGAEEPRTVSRPLARAFRFVHGSLPQPAARILRLLSLAPAGLADAHTASALAGCSIPAAQAALEEFAALGLLRAHGPQFEVPGCLMPLLGALVTSQDRPAEVELARARMLERTVRLLQSCWAITEPDGSVVRRKLAGLPRSLRFTSAPAAAAWLRQMLPALLASARLAAADGELDTLARRLVAALVRALAAHRGTDAAAPERYALHQLLLKIAERRGLHRERAAALLDLGDLDAGAGRIQQALARYRAALDAGRSARDPYTTGRATESVGGAHQELGDLQRAADWYGRALAHRQSRGEQADESRLHGRLGTVQARAGQYVDALRSWRAAVAGHRRLGDLAGQARALGELAGVQESGGQPDESLRTRTEAVECARRAVDVRLQAALELRLADALDRRGDAAAARLHRGSAERLLVDLKSAYEIRGVSAED